MSTTTGFLYDADDPGERPESISERTWEAMASSIATNRALGTTGAKFEVQEQGQVLAHGEAVRTGRIGALYTVILTEEA